MDLGFQLSCAATLGLVTVGPVLGGASGAWAWLRRSMAPTLSAQLTALPILVARFHAISWVAPLANLAAVPVAGMLLACAWLAITVDLAVPGAGRAWFGACEVLASILRIITEFSARMPSALLASGSERGTAWLAAVGAALIALGWSAPRDLEGVRRGPGPLRTALRLLGVWASLLALVLAATARPLVPEAGKHWLVVLDVGQGDALALGFPDGWWLVDAGPRGPRYDAGESVVLPFLRWAGVRGLEALVVSHGDGDHEGGASAVLRGTRVARVWTPPPFPSSPGPQSRLGGVAIGQGERLRERPSVRVLWPPRTTGASGRSIRGDNDASVVLELGERQGRALLLADVDSTIEALLPVDSGVAVLKVAHHGSASSSGATFLTRARPRRAAISCGRRNPFGHPAPGAMARLAAAGCTIERTDSAGALWYEADEGGVRRIDWRRAAWPSRDAEKMAPQQRAPAAAPRSP
jgi:competence protein ComEC